MATGSKNRFDGLPDELVEYIFLLIVYPPSIESFDPVQVPTSPFHFPYDIHQPEVRRTFKDLLSLGKVCRRFYHLLRSPTFWLQKCRHDHWPIINESLAIAQGVDIRRLYFSNPFHPDYNLLDPIDRDGQYWNGNISYEPTPAGSDLLYDAFGRVSSCFATSFTWGHYCADDIRLLRRGEEMVSCMNWRN